MIGPPASLVIDRIRNGILKPLIVNLYASNVGYSVVFPAADGRKWTTRCFNYEDEHELLDDIEHNRLPLFLIDLIDRYCCNPSDSGPSTIFFEGCIGVEVRDFRQREENCSTEILDEKKYNVSFAVLRPTLATLLNDLENLQQSFAIMEKRKEMEIWKERPSLMETADSVFALRARFDHQRTALEADFWRLVSSSGDGTNAGDSSNGGLAMKRKRCLRYDVRARRRRETALLLEQHFPIMHWVVNNVSPRPYPPSFSFSRLNDKTGPSSAATSSTSQWKPMIPSAVKTPMEIAEKRLQRVQQGERENGMELVEEYCVELPAIKYKTRARIKIYKRCLDAVYVGHLRMERENCTPVTSPDANEQQDQQELIEAVSECSFILGTEAGSRSYIRQYLDMISEGGRRPLTLTRRIPGRPPQTVPPAIRGIDVGGVVAIPVTPNPPVIIPVHTSTAFQTFPSI